MKIIITESQYEMLFKELPTSLKRRLTPDDFKYFDTNLVYHIDDSTWIPNFNEFSYDVIGTLVSDFITETRGDEIGADFNPDYGATYDVNSFNNVFEMYSDLIPVLEKKYKNRLYQAWKVKGRSR
jgi:hypothetical protein